MSLSLRIPVLALLAPLAACTINETRAPAPREPGAPTQTSAPGAHHPAYLHALSDLRNARANLERKGGDAAMRWDERAGIEHIDRAIAEIKQAALDDGKNLDEHPPVDAREPRSGRLHKALAALRTARSDIERQEENAGARGLRNRAIQHIDAAIRATEEGINDASHGS